MEFNVTIDDHLMQDVEELAVLEGKTVNELIEDSLRERVLRSREYARQPYTKLPVFTGGGGLREGLDPEILSSNSRLADVLDGYGDPGPDGWE